MECKELHMLSVNLEGFQLNRKREFTLAIPATPIWRYSMAYSDEIYETIADNYGIVTAAQARGVSATTGEAAVRRGLKRG